MHINVRGPAKFILCLIYLFGCGRRVERTGAEGTAAPPKLSVEATVAPPKVSVEATVAPPKLSAEVNAPSSSITPPSSPDAGRPMCHARTLSEDEVKQIISKERSQRTDLPKPFPSSTWQIRQTGCYYTAIEWTSPAVPDAVHIFKLNRDGVIVDVQIGNSAASGMKCPAKTFSEAELGKKVASARGADPSLPAPYKQSRIHVSRKDCLYYYFEYQVPEKPEAYSVFTIDGLGEVMEGRVNRPFKLSP